MKINRFHIALLSATFLLGVVTAVGAQYATKVYIEQGGAKMVVASGGEVEVQSGGTLDVQSGATLTINSSSFAPASYATLAGAAFTGPVSFADDFKLVGAAAPLIACAAGSKGNVYYDSDINKLCVCNGTNYVLVDDATTTTGCS